jgi:hypothetical protein
MQCALLELGQSPVLFSLQENKGWQSWTLTAEAQDTWSFTNYLSLVFPTHFA